MSKGIVDSIGYSQFGHSTIRLDIQQAASDSANVGTGRFISHHTIDSLRRITVLDGHIRSNKAELADTASHEKFFSTILTPHTVEPLPQHIEGNNTASSVLMLCVFAVFFLIVGSWNGLHQQSKDFFMPPRQHFDQLNIDTERETYVHVLMNLMLCVIFGVLVTYYVANTLPKGEMLTSISTSMWVFSGCFAVYYGIRFLLYRFTNWVFFDRVKNFNWNESSLFLICVQTMAFLPLALLAVYSGFSLRFMVFLAVLMLLIIKMLLLYRTNSIFFGKFHCALHLIAYLCTLEVLPMLTLYEVLSLTASHMITKY